VEPRGGSLEGLRAFTLPAASDSVRRVVEAAGQESAQPVPEDWVEVKGAIPSRSSFYEAMTREGVSDSVIYALARAARPLYNLGRVRPGQEYRLAWSPDGELARLTFRTGEADMLEVSLSDQGYRGEFRRIEFDTHLKTVSGEIRSSLFESLQETGAPVELASQMAEVLGWEIDFFRDIRSGDRFRILYEERWRDGEFSHLGRVRAAEFVNRGKTHYAFYFVENPENGLGGYYDEKGNSLQRQLLRAPLKYTRISSTFTSHRLHPIHHRYAPHYGVDYVAPRGTRVHATGSGVVEVARYRRGNGNYVRIRHNTTYTTYYLHLSGYAPGIRPGVRVERNQVVGYVGSTGYATGAHLDYRIKKNGRFVNPRTLKLPPERPVPDGRRPAFLRHVATCLALLKVPESRRPEIQVASGAQDDGGDAGDAGDRQSPGAF
jgi:murein DD-endopeptidase MepM/ murein hydrolase activator NlpD